MDMKASGYEALIGKLERLPREGRRRAEKKALQAVGKLIKEAEQERAPVRVSPLTPGSTGLPAGALKEDIHVRVEIGEGLDPSTVTIGPGSKTRHVAGFVEFGHTLVKNKKPVGTVAADPYIRPTFESTEEQAVETFVKVAGEQLAKELES